MALFQSQENFAQDSVTVIFHRADPNSYHGQMNWVVIGLHGFHTDTSSIGLFEDLGCIIPKDYKVLVLERTQQSLSLGFLSPTPISFYRSQEVTCLRSNS